MSVVALKVILCSLLGGLVVGAFAQKSRMCFIGGWRDFFLIRDTYLLKGFFSFVISAAILFFAFDAADLYLKNYPWFNRTPTVVSAVDGGFILTEPESLKHIDYCELGDFSVIIGVDTVVKGLHIGNITIPNEVIMYIIAAFVIGLFSTIANGCPLRQHVMAASGNLSSMTFLLGFYSAIIFFEVFLSDFFNSLIN